MTKHTSLVAVEQVVSRPKDQQLKTSPAPINLPHGWRYNSVFGTAEERTLAMPEAEEKERKRKLAEMSHRKAKVEYEKIRRLEERKLSEVLMSHRDVLRPGIGLAKVENSNFQLAADVTKLKELEATSQSMAIAKLQENAGIIPKTATPAALFLILGLTLLTLAGYFRIRRVRM